MNPAVYLAVIFFLIQGLVISADEILCHRRRILPKWELIGHPLDTICLFGFFVSLRLLAPLGNSVLVLGIGLISCLITTKDEWVHKLHSNGFENWLHAVLFLVHAWVVALFFWLWINDVPELNRLVTFAAGAILLFFLYQCADGVRRWRSI